MDMVSNRAFAEALMDRNLEVRLPIAGRALEEVGDYVDLVVTADDPGMTDRTLVSPALYRSLIKPQQKRAFEFLKALTSAKLYLYSDGAIYPFKSDLIEMGVDALNPIQVSVEGMGDTKKLKAECGDKLTFWGGIDTRHAVPFGTGQTTP
jgi:uroporphyrinogen decarboxylase